jgi:alcohol dehydrogenase class IV
MDIAKWLRLRPDSGDDRELELLLSSTVQPPGWTRHELWLLPTTAGTGSEVTRWSTMWDTESKSAPKRSFDQAYAYADRAVVDPLLCLSCPHSVVLHSGLDAFGHCLEVLWNRHRNPVSVALAIDAARVIVRSLPLALSEPNDVTARVSLAQAALQAGMAFSQTRTALAHALSYALTIEQGVDHGAAVAVWLPVTWKMAAGHSEEVDAALQQIWNSPSITGPNRMMQWFAQIGFDTSLKSLGIDDVALRVQAALTHERGRNFEGRWMDGEG